jgi:hypothetical protein
MLIEVRSPLKTRSIENSSAIRLLKGKIDFACTA